jgi:Helix-turn-helix domain
MGAEFANTVQERTSIGVSKAAEELGLSPQAVRDLIRSKKLKGQKNSADRWRIDPDSLSRYLSEHGRKEGVLSGLERLGQRLDELDRRIDSLSDLAAVAALQAAERERDKYRSDAATLREVVRLYAESTEETEAAFANLRAASQKQREALAQLLRPASVEDLMPSGGRGQAP